MIFQQFYGDIALGQQSHVVVKLARRNRTGAFFLHLGRAGGTQAEVQISGSNSQFVASGLE